MSNSASPAIGIDLGTTNSCVAIFQHGKVEVIANSQGSRVTSSVVAFTEEERIIGEGAEIQRTLDPERAIYNGKRFIGKKWEEVKGNLDLYPFKIEERDNKIQFKIGLKKEILHLAPEGISGAILSRMKKIAEDYLEETVKDAVITVPAYFTDSQRQATKDAGTIAGLNVLRIINEPTAAAMAYGLQKEAKKNVLVYDLGGGTFDVSVLEIEDDIFEVKSTCGNTELGGEDLNSILVKHFQKIIFRDHGVDLSSNLKAIRRLTNACEILKRNLSAEYTRQSRIDLDNFLPNGEDFSAAMSRAQFENLCKPLFDETIDHVKQALKDAGITKENIDEVVLVGGSSRIPKIQSMLSEYFGYKSVNNSVNPDEAVACGAAIQAAILTNQHQSLKDILLMDVTPLSLGIDLDGGITRVVIERNTMIPVQKQKVFVTAEDYQTSILFSVTEGERAMTKDNKILGSFTMYNIPEAPAGEEFNVIFDLDANGILQVSATHRGTGTKKGITLDARTSGRLSVQDIEDLVKKAEEMKIKDEKEENRIRSRNKLEALCSKIRIESRGKEDCLSLTNKVEENLQWIGDHPNASEDHFCARHDQLELAALKKLKRNLEVYNPRRSSHVFNLSRMTAKTYLDLGNKQLETKTVKSMTEALGSFRKAYELGSEKGKIDKMALASQGMGHTCRILIELKKEKKSADLFINAAFTLTEAMILGQKYKVIDERTIIDDMKFVCEEFIQMFSDQEDVMHDFMRVFVVSNQTMSTEWNRIVFNCRVRHIETILEVIEKHLQNEDFKTVLSLFGEMEFFFKEAEKLVETDTESEQLFEIKREGNTSASIAEGLKYISLSEEILKDSTDDMIDQTLLALDFLREAKDRTKYNDMKIFCKAKTYEGKLFLEKLLNKKKAKDCFMEVIDISITQQYTNTEWYHEANALFKELKEKEVKVMNPDLENKSIMKELEKELNQLREASKLSFRAFVDFLFDKFPPVHKENCEKPDTSEGCNQKKTCLKLSSYYHPDKVDVSIHGQKHKVLCGEITKQINSRYAEMKMS